MYTKSSQHSDTNQLEHRLENLRKKLVGFEVVNQQNEVIGMVENLVIDATQHLTFVVTRSLTDPLQKSFLLESKLIDHVNPKSRTLSVHLNSLGLAELPVYPMQPSEADLVQPDYPLSSRHSVADPRAIESERSRLDVTSGEPSPIKALEEDIVQEETIRLLEERLSVSYQKQKVGEVIVRKEIETRMIQVPVRREKLIVEQVGDSPRRLAEIDLAQGEIEGLEFLDAPTDAIGAKGNVLDTASGSTVHGEVSSPRTAAWLLDAIARQSKHGCKRIRIEIELDDPSHQDAYQSWFDRCR